MRNDILYSLAFGLIAGVLIQSLGRFSLAYILFPSFLSLVLILLGILKKKQIFLLGAFLFACISLGMFRFYYSDYKLSLQKFSDTSISERALVVENPELKNGSKRVIVEFEKSHIKALVSLDAYTPILYGDYLSISGTLSRPQNFKTDQGKTFDYISYLKKDGIVYQIKYPQIEIISHDKGNILLKKLYTLRSNFLQSLNRFIPNPEVSLAGGIILGGSDTFSKDLKQEFITTGTIHIVALSGYNVTIIAESLMRLFSFLPFMVGLSFGAVSIVLFALMSGAGSTVLRASIMSLLTLLARATGRLYDIGRALLIAGIIMLMLNPWILVYDISFQLSFLATIGLIYLTPLVKQKLSFLTTRFEIRELVSATLATNIFVLPFLLYTTGIFSIVSLPANLLILPLMSLTMLMGFLTGACSFIPLLSKLFGGLSYILLHYELGVVHFFASLPFASIQANNVSGYIIFLIYIFLVGYMVWLYKPTIDK